MAQTVTRTTLKIASPVMKQVHDLARMENRTMTNMIETILIRYFESFFYVDDQEMEEIKNDKELLKSLQEGLKDYKAGRGRYVDL